MWITPLRALANDLAINVQAASDLVDAGWRVGIRTGDTTAAQRRQQKTNAAARADPDARSLSVLMSDLATHDALAGVQSVVVDEWHELLGTKRGVQLELCLAHLRVLSPSLRTWGLSATLANLDEACIALVGKGREGELIRSGIIKPVDARIAAPSGRQSLPVGRPSRRATAGAGARPQSRRRTTTLLFTNTRSQAELWYQAIVNASVTGSPSSRCTTGRSIDAFAPASRMRCAKAAFAASSRPPASTSASTFRRSIR